MQRNITKKYVLYSPESLMYLKYVNQKQEFEQTFNITEALITSVTVPVGAVDSPLDHHQKILKQKLEANFRRQFAQRSLLLDCLVVEVEEFMVRSVSKVNKSVVRKYGDFLDDDY